MNRFHKAWLALTGELPETREVVRKVPVYLIGDLHSTWLYRVCVSGYFALPHEYKYFSTIEAALNTGRPVTKVPAVRAENGYFIPCDSLALVEVEDA